MSKNEMINLPNFDGADYSVDERVEQYVYWTKVAKLSDFKRGEILIEQKENDTLDEFLVKMKDKGFNIGEARIKALIKFYNDSGEFKLSTEPTADLKFPETAKVLEPCVGVTPLEKAENYKAVRDASGDDLPSENQVRAFNGKPTKRMKISGSHQDLIEEGKKYRAEKEAQAITQSQQREDARVCDIYNDVWIEVGEELLHLAPKEYDDFRMAHEAEKMFGDIKGWKNFLRTISKQYNTDNGTTPDKEIIQTLNHIKEYVDMGVTVANSDKMSEQYAKAVEEETIKRVEKLPEGKEAIKAWFDREEFVANYRKGN